MTKPNPVADRYRTALDLCRTYAKKNGGLVRLAGFAAEARAASVYFFHLRKLCDLGFLVRETKLPPGSRITYRLSKSPPSVNVLNDLTQMRGDPEG